MTKAFVDFINPGILFDTLIPDLCVAILAGGRSRRMGFNKALLNIHGRPLIAVLAERVLTMTDQIIISANDPQHYVFLGFPVISDLFAGQGPLAGLHAVMVQSTRPLVLLLACDLPNVRQELLQRLAESAEGYDAVIPQTSDGRIHPLCAIYRCTCLPFVEQNLRQGINKMTDLFQNPTPRVKWLQANEGHFQDSDFDNINTPKDLARYRGIRRDNGLM